MHESVKMLENELQKREEEREESGNRDKLAEKQEALRR